MKLLLDTHILLWLITGTQLTQTAKEAIINLENELYFSAASYWEICVKMSIGKLVLPANWQKVIEEAFVVNDIQWLPVSKRHCEGVIDLPFYHKDPFDRLLIAQATAEDIVILTADRQFAQYNVQLLQ